LQTWLCQPTRLERIAPRHSQAGCLPTNELVTYEPLNRLAVRSGWGRGRPELSCIEIKWGLGPACRLSVNAAPTSLAAPHHSRGSGDVDAAPVYLYSSLDTGLANSHWYRTACSGSMWADRLMQDAEGTAGWSTEGVSQLPPRLLISLYAQSTLDFEWGDFLSWNSVTRQFSSWFFLFLFLFI
jgi:hypothetical protein